MSRTIVVAVDGTNNDPRRGRTNVSRFFRMLTKDPTRQVAYYQPGVGTLDPEIGGGSPLRKLRRLWDLGTAWMMRRHVLAAYRFLMNEYEAGDRIALVGFSRGAYTCRVLAGMLGKVGLLHRGHDEMAAFAWRLFEPLNNPQEAGRFKRYYAQDVEIQFLGLWETVRSVGAPWKPKVFPNTFKNPHVHVVRHALALDERRVFYGTNLWTSHPAKGQDVLQVFFPGVHSDVGGGYTGDGNEGAGLGAIPLAWMVREAKAAGFLFERKEEERLLWRKDTPAPPGLDLATITREFAADPAHDEIARRLGWRLGEWLPVPHSVRREDGTWTRRLHIHRAKPRFVPDECRVHESVRLRRERLDDYRPTNLPEGLSAERWVD